MKRIWLLYDTVDLAANRDFAAMMNKRGAEREWFVEAVTLRELTLTMDLNGVPACLRKGAKVRPDAILSRMRVPLYSRHFEAMGVPVFNGAKVCEICNDKRRTYQFLAGLPIPDTVFLSPHTPPPSEKDYPLVVKPACSHGGDRVTLVRDREQWQTAVQGILPEPALYQKLVEKPGRDLRVYVLFGQIVAGVMRTAQSGIVSNFKLGGMVERHILTTEEEQLARQVIQRFDAAGAPLCFAGVDLLYESYGPVVSEVEDVVGSRMLYRTSDLDIASLYLDALRDRI